MGNEIVSISEDDFGSVRANDCSNKSLEYATVTTPIVNIRIKDNS